MDRPSEPEFRIVSERVAYKRWVRLLDRRVAYPDGREFDYDVAATSFFTLAVAWHSHDRTFTLIREYAQGPNTYPAPSDLVYAFAGGKWERDKIGDMLESAQAELAEEAQLTGGRWLPLLPEGHKGIAELKWSSNLFAPFLVVDPIEAENPPARDDEEYIQICRHVPLAQLRDWILGGEMMLPSVQAALLAVARLRKDGVSIAPEEWL